MSMDHTSGSPGSSPFPLHLISWDVNVEGIDGDETDDDDVSSYGENIRSFFQNYILMEHIYICMLYIGISPGSSDLLRLIYMVQTPGSFTHETNRMCAAIITNPAIKECKQIRHFLGISGFGTACSVLQES